MYGTPPAAAGPLAAHHAEILERVERAVILAQQEELLRKGQSTGWATMFWSVAHGLASLTIADAIDGSPRAKPGKRTASQRERRALDLARAATASLIFGMKAADSNWQPQPGK